MCAAWLHSPLTVGVVCLMIMDKSISTVKSYATCEERRQKIVRARRLCVWLRQHGIVDEAKDDEENKYFPIYADREGSFQENI